ncbi:hypothetical protein [Burkholderia cepacia]|uniref:hypothetical protein n=1 Tax=Burkholderia cepacia TaxID=292 RepID=UPI002AB7B149|nr:hypothetical protein [Burkholderia cepacia]
MTQNAHMRQCDDYRDLASGAGVVKMPLRKLSEKCIELDGTCVLIALQQEPDYFGDQVRDHHGCH